MISSTEMSETKSYNPNNQKKKQRFRAGGFGGGLSSITNSNITTGTTSGTPTISATSTNCLAEIIGEHGTLVRPTRVLYQ